METPPTTTSNAPVPVPATSTSSGPSRPALHRVQDSRSLHVHWEDFVKASASSMALQRQKTDTFRIKLQDQIDSMCVQTTVFAFVVADIVIGLTSILEDEQLRSYITLTVIIVYSLEMSLRLYAYGPIKYFSSMLEIVDFVAVIASLLMYFFAIYVAYALLVKIVRWLRTAYTSYQTVFSRTKKLKRIQSTIRHLHAPNRRGYRDEKYDLDIAYITDHILVMSRPAARAYQFTHDSLSDVKNFLDEKHKGCYRIYDLCVYNDSGQDQCPTIGIHGTHHYGSHHDLHAPSPSPVPRTHAIESHERSVTKSHPSLHDHHSRELDVDHSRDIGQREPDTLRPNRPNRKSTDMDATSSYMSLFPLGVHVDSGDSPNVQYETFGDEICNEFAFRHSAVLQLEKLFAFAEKSTMYANNKGSNVIIIQSTNGLGRCMFMCACLLFYYYPTASLSEIMKFIYNERLNDVHKKIEHSMSRHSDHDPDHHPHDEKELEDDLFHRFLPSQTRYLQYFATLILHCYREAATNGEVADEIQELEENLAQHIQQIQHHHQMSLMDHGLINAYSKIEKSKWNFYHQHAQDLMSTKIGVVIKQIGIHNFYEEIDPYVRWEADIFQWVEAQPEEAENEMDTRFQRIDYDVYTYGADHEPGRSSAVIRRGQDVPPKVLEKDFGIRIFKVKETRFEDEEQKPMIKRKLKAQLILHSHFLSLDEEHRITFSKQEIDFVAKDTHHRHFPKDFHIVVEARILKKKL